PYRVVGADTNCCGDSFDAGFLTAWLQGKTPQECLQWGHACGALVASAPGNAADRLSPEAIQRVLTTGSVSP
ncbi:MAG: PfkB family carbohydrate kinase, partial [Armatimonadia bacterium]